MHADDRPLLDSDAFITNDNKTSKQKLLFAPEHDDGAIVITNWKHGAVARLASAERRR